MDDALSFESLLAGAQHFARQAMQAHNDQNVQVFALHAGVSVERLAKAALAKVSPFLLMETKTNNDDMLFHFAGVMEAPKVRTIGASGAISRLRKMGHLPQRDPGLDELIELRNGVAHLGPGTSDGENLLAAFARVTNQLLEHLKEGVEEYWAVWYPTIELSVNDQMEKIEREVRQRMERARHTYERKYAHLPRAAFKGVVAVLRQGELNFKEWIDDNGFKSGWILCPVCKSHSLALFDRELFGDGSPEDLQGAFKFTHCQYCGLSLTGLDELAVAGIDITEIQVTHNNGSDAWIQEVARKLGSLIPPTIDEQNE